MQSKKKKPCLQHITQRKVNDMQCSFNKKTTHDNGSWTNVRCISQARILATNDPCYGLCYGCAYEKTKADNEKYSDICEGLHKDCAEFQAELAAGKRLWMDAQKRCKAQALRGDKLQAELEQMKDLNTRKLERILVLEGELAAR